jgi:DNA polymerase III delta prime subunit
MQTDNDEFLYVEKYRPQKVSDCILPKHLLDTFNGFVQKGEIVNMTFHGPKGSGKTTVARALCEELGCDMIFINGSEDNGIDMLRTKLRNFASTISFNGGVKVAIIDEAEKMNVASTQKAFTAFIEEFSKNCRFIFTTNNQNGLIPALLSRAPVIDFNIPEEDRPKMAARFMARTKEILTAENITYDEKVLVKVIMKFFPDYRAILGHLQIYGVGGKIDVGILSTMIDANLKPLIDVLKEKDFNKMRQWVASNQVDNTFFGVFFDAVYESIDKVPQLVIMMNDYQYKAAFVENKELNVAACLTEFMATCNFK